MVTAIPTVKPSSTGQGTNWIMRPSPLRPIPTTITPAMMATDGNGTHAVVGDDGHQHDGHGAGWSGDLH